MGKIRDTVNSIDYQEAEKCTDIKPKERKSDNPLYYVEDAENGYSYDCDNCKFKRYMEALGFSIDSFNCWIDCTINIKDELDNVFGFILSKTFENKQNAILYTGKMESSKEKLS